MEDIAQVNLQEKFQKLVNESLEYFDKCEEARISAGVDKPHYYFGDIPRTYYWDALPSELQAKCAILVDNLLRFVGEIAPFVKASPLNSEGDQRDLVIAVKIMRAALGLREYRYWEVTVLHDEGEFLGVQPAGQSDDTPLDPQAAKQKYLVQADRLIQIIQLIMASGTLARSNTDSNRLTTGSYRYRQGTAFIIMSMDKNKPELDDVRDAVVEVFGKFGIQAIRADDIEHQEVINNKILDEIATSEFLFADLSGERPNVYYEVGYAHALKKSVILYRKNDTNLHFDLAGYNCPTYENLKELKRLLTKRLETITNKKITTTYD